MTKADTKNFTQPANLVCRLPLPVPVKELAAISDALAKIARKQGKEARIKQVGQTLEIFTVQDGKVKQIMETLINLNPPADTALPLQRPVRAVFEVVDASDEEKYYPLGIYLDEAEALAVLDADAPPYNDDDPESVVVEVRRRPTGFHPHAFAVIATRTWVRDYETGARHRWIARPIDRPNVKVSRCGENAAAPDDQSHEL